MIPNIENRINRMCVVGDKLIDFSNNKNVITISNFEKLIKSNLTTNNRDKYIFFIGQGVCSKRLKKIYTMISRAELSNYFKINIPKSYRKSTSRLTHKHKEQNVMISEPIFKGKDEYECLLMLDDYCAEMSDHVTGQHIQGMILIEAARQMVIAVTEEFFITDDNKGKLNFVTHRIDTVFNHFIFPLPVTIHFKIIEMKISRNNNLSCTAKISFSQDNVIATEIVFKYSALDFKFIADKESEMADKCIQSQLRENKNKFI